jgi:hypothetical protein
MRLNLVLAACLSAPLLAGAAVRVGPAFPADAAASGDGVTQSGAALAFNGEIYLLAWTQDDPLLAGRVRAVRVSRDGTVLDDDPIELGAGTVSNVTVASARKSFLVAWERRGDLLNATCTMEVYDSDVMAARVSAAGFVELSEHVLRSGPFRQESPSLASDDVDYLLTWQDMTDFDGTSGPTVVRLARLDGETLRAAGDDVVLSQPVGRSPSIAVAGGMALVAWAGPYELQARRIDARTGVALDSRPLTLGRADGGRPRCAAGDGEGAFLVAWLAQGARACRPVVVIVPMSGDPRPAMTVPWEAGCRSTLALGKIDGAWMLAWHASTEPAIVGARFSPAGSLLDSEPLVLHAGGTARDAPALQGADCSDGLLAFADRDTAAIGGARIQARHVSDDWAATREVSPPGARPLGVRLSPGGLVVSFEGHGSCAATRIAVGRIGEWSLASAERSLPHAGDEASIPTPLGSAWLVAVATDGALERTAGHDSFGTER